MAPGAATDHGFQADLAAEFNEMAQVALTGPVELTLDFLVVDPEDVGGDDVNATGFHFEEFFAPLVFGITRVMELAHDRCPGASVKPQALAVQGEDGAVRTAWRAHIKPGGPRSCGLRDSDG